MNRVNLRTAALSAQLLSRRKDLPHQVGPQRGIHFLTTSPRSNKQRPGRLLIGAKGALEIKAFDKQIAATIRWTWCAHSKRPRKELPAALCDRFPLEITS